MKVTWENTEKIEFKLLCAGDVFVHDGDPCIAISLVGSDGFNAVSLKNGHVYKFMGPCLVEVVDAELVIKGTKRNE